jgi:hypothetical protein
VKRKILVIAGIVAATALAVRGALELRQGTGWPLFLIAAAILVAIAVRQFVFRD